MRTISALAFLLLLTACNDSASGDPLVSGSTTGSYDGHAFTVVNGFATVNASGDGLILLGDGPIHCGSESASSPPSGYNAAIQLPALAAGDYSAVAVQMYKNVGGFEGSGSNTGTVTITSVTDATVAGQVSFTYTDSNNRMFSLSGTFEVVHCPP